MDYHGLLYQEDGILSLSRRVKACRVGQFQRGNVSNIALDRALKGGYNYINGFN